MRPPICERDWGTAVGSSSRGCGGGGKCWLPTAAHTPKKAWGTGGYWLSYSHPKICQSSHRPPSHCCRPPAPAHLSAALAQPLPLSQEEASAAPGLEPTMGSLPSPYTNAGGTCSSCLPRGIRAVARSYPPLPHAPG